MWAIPWLGLPLGALAAVVILTQSLADPGLLGSSAGASPAPAPVPASAPRLPSTPPSPDRTSSLAPGETLGGVLRGLGVDADDAFAAAVAAQRYVDARQLRAGTAWAAYLDDDGEVRRFELELAGRGELTLTRGQED